MDWFVTGDYTFWTAREDNIEFAVGTIVQGPGAVKGGGKGHIYRPDDKWVSGFKVGMGTDFCHDGWDLYAEYTWFKSTSSNNKPQGFSPNFMFGDPTLGDIYWNIDAHEPEFNGYTSASAKWRLNMNIVDLELGRNFYVSPRLMLRPFYGLKGAWNKQKMNVAFVGIQSTQTGTFIPIVASMDNALKTWGIGLRAGVDTSWHFCRNFSILGDLAFTALWEQFKSRRYDNTASGGAVLDSFVDNKENQYLVKPIIEWMAGLKWETGLSCDAYHLSITAAWEEQVWFGQNQFMRTRNTSVGTGGDLTLQGLTVDVRFDF